ncbi:hypothetical protein M514_06556, partial [Trichuris suis]
PSLNFNVGSETNWLPPIIIIYRNSHSLIAWSLSKDQTERVREGLVGWLVVARSGDGDRSCQFLWPSLAAPPKQSNRSVGVARPWWRRTSLQEEEEEEEACRQLQLLD